jgi:Tol biopolymer transport system component
MPLQPGARLYNRYRIDKVLGQGGMGAVYQAYDVNLGVAVAVKENLFTTEEYSRQFRREATILASLRHPNLPRVTDHFVIENEGQYLVMDFIAGEDLRQRLERSGPVPESEALPWFLQICDALAYLHSRIPPILHRDIKPGNIKLTSDGRALLVDFGLAKVVEEGGSTTTGAKAMTPGFSPPEQYGSGRTDPRTDVYSLGATLYAALTATIPEDALEQAMGRERLTPLRKRNPHVSAAVARAVERALAVRPEDRFQTASDLGAALSSATGASKPSARGNYPFLEQQTLVPSQATLPIERGTQPVGAPKPRKRWPVIGLAVAIVAVIGAGAAFAIPNLRPRLAAMLVPSSAPAAGETAIPGGGLLTPAPSEAGATALATPAGGGIVPPQGTATPLGGGGPATPLPTVVGGGIGQLAFASNRSGVPQIYLMNIDGTDITQLTHLTDGACQPAWSPDGTKLLFVAPCLKSQDSYPGSSLWLMDVQANSVEPLRTVPGGDFDPAWSPDGKWIAFTSLRTGRPQIFLMAADGSGLKKLSGDLSRDSQPAWSPNGTQILYISLRSGFPEIWMMPETGGDETRFSKSAGREDTHPHWSNDGQLIVFEQKISNIPRIVATRFEDHGVPEFQVCREGPLSSQPMAGAQISPDGRWLVFETWPSGSNHEIAMITTSCTNYRELTDDPAADFDPAWRP